MLSGMVMAVASAVMFGLNPVLISRFRGFEAPVVFVGLRSIVGFVALSVLVNPFVLGGLDPYLFFIIFTSAVTDMGIGTLFYTKSIEYLGGGHATVIGFTFIFVSQAIAFTFLGEDFTPSLIAGAALALAGIVISLWEPGGSRRSALGVVYAAIASLGWGIGTALIKPGVAVLGDPTLVTTLRLLITASIFTPIGLVLEKRAMRRETVRNLIAASITTGVISLAVGVSLFTYAVKQVGVSASVIALALTPILTQALTRVINKEELKPRHIIGGAVVSAGIALASI